MPDKITLACPHCKNVGQTTHFIRAGAKVHCSRCKRSFRFSRTESDESNPDAELRSIGDLALREFFTPEVPPPTPLSTKPIDRSNGNGNGNGNGNVRERKRRATDQPFVQDPLAARSERSKDVYITGKPLRFTASRKGLAVVLIFLVLALGYGAILGVGYFMEELRPGREWQAGGAREAIQGKEREGTREVENKGRHCRRYYHPRKDCHPRKA